MVRTLHLSNTNNRNATVAMENLPKPILPKLGLPDQSITYHRYLISTEEGLHEAMQSAHGDKYAQALVDGDPEVDMELVGRAVGPTSTVYLSGDGEVLYAAPQMFDVRFDPKGQEQDRKPAENVASNTTDELPVKWTGKKMPIGDVVRRFSFKRSVAVQHVDGLTFDFCYAMAKELHDEGVMVLLGAGSSGKEPLIFQENGSPYRGFLSGQVEGDNKYKLLLHLSNLELKSLVKDD